MNGPAIRAAGLVKDYGFRRVLQGVDLEVPAGSVLALFGPNGAGKTTLIRILATVARPTAGTVEIAGWDIRGPGRTEARQALGLISHRTLLYDTLTGLENLLFFGRLYGIARPRERAGELLAEMGLWERRNDPVRTYSRGMQQRLAIARALVHDPSILLLDEPFTGLDPAATRLFAALLERLRGARRTILLVTHDLAEGLALADRWAILVAGRMSAEGACAGASEAWVADRYFQLAGGTEAAP